jgi:hypothetical protein
MRIAPTQADTRVSKPYDEARGKSTNMLSSYHRRGFYEKEIAGSIRGCACIVRQEGVAEASISRTFVGNLRQAATRYKNSRLCTLYLCIPLFDDSLTFLVLFVAK